MHAKTDFEQEITEETERFSAGTKHALRRSSVTCLASAVPLSHAFRPPIQIHLGVFAAWREIFCL